MVRSIRHKGLKRLYEHGDARELIREHAEKLRDILVRLGAARVPSRTWTFRAFTSIPL